MELIDLELCPAFAKKNTLSTAVRLELFSMLRSGKPAGLGVCIEL
jgi:hypothetical protein